MPWITAIRSGEEREVFQMAGKELDDEQKSSLATAYRSDMNERTASEPAAQQLAFA